MALLSVFAWIWLLVLVLANAAFLGVVFWLLGPRALRSRGPGAILLIASLIWLVLGFVGVMFVAKLEILSHYANDSSEAGVAAMFFAGIVAGPVQMAVVAVPFFAGTQMLAAGKPARWISRLAELRKWEKTIICFLFPVVAAVVVTMPFWAGG